MGILLRTSLLLVAAGLLARLAVGPLVLVRDAGTPVSFDALLQAALAAVLLAALAWWVTGAVLTTVADLLVRVRPASVAARLCTAAAERVTPVLVRRLLTAGLGVAVTGGALAGPASADPGGQRSAQAQVAADQHALAGLPLPDRAVGGGPAAGPAAGPARSGPPTVRVRPGDSLWSIAEAHLPARATDARVAATARAIHAANAERIGADPARSHPGTELHLPAPHREDRR